MKSLWFVTCGEYIIFLCFEKKKEKRIEERDSCLHGDLYLTALYTMQSGCCFRERKLRLDCFTAQDRWVELWLNHEVKDEKGRILEKSLF